MSLQSANNQQQQRQTESTAAAVDATTTSPQTQMPNPSSSSTKTQSASTHQTAQSLSAAGTEALALAAAVEPASMATATTTPISSATFAQCTAPATNNPQSSIECRSHTGPSGNVTTVHQIQLQPSTNHQARANQQEQQQQTGTSANNSYNNNNSSPSLTNPDTRTHVVGELYDTERSYVESLQILIEKYMKPLKSVESSRVLIESNLVDEIFYTIPEILKHHETFLSALQDRLSSDWDTSQVIGNVFIEAFTNQQIIDTYTAFINNWKNARQAIKIASQAKPAFEKFLEAMSREHRNKLTLDALLIMPVQRIPRYELLIKELIKHTPENHPDHGPLIHAQKEIHELALKIDRAEREMIHQEQLKDIESLIEGHVELQHPQRDFIRYDLVTILGASALTVAKKERVLFLFCDLLIMTSVKKKASRRSNLQAAFANSSNDLSLLEGNKFKLLLRVSLDQVEVRLSNDQIQIHQQQQEQQYQFQLKQQEKMIQDQKRELESDLNILQQMSSLSAKLIVEDKGKMNDTMANLTNLLKDKLNLLEQSDVQSINGRGLFGAQQLSSAMKLTPDYTTGQTLTPGLISSNHSPNQSSISPNNLNTSTTPAIGSGSSMISNPGNHQTFNLSSTPTSISSTNHQQESNTSLEFLISNSNFVAGNNSNKDNYLTSNSGNNELISGEQGFVFANQINSSSDFQSFNHPQHFSNCESLVVTFASIERHQAFLHAFIEAKQQRYHQQQRQQQLQQKHQLQQQRMYSTSAVLRLTQPASPDRRSPSHDPRKAKLYHQDNVDSRFTSSSSPVRANKMSIKNQVVNAATRISSAPMGKHGVSCGATIVHQMSAPQSLALVSTSPLEASIQESSSHCVSCSSSNPTMENDKCQQQHHHHHQLMHQPNSQPASLDTICCHEKHNDDLRLSAGSSKQRLSQLNESNDLDLTDDQNNYLDYYQQMQQQLSNNLIVDPTNELNSQSNTDRQKFQLMSHMNHLLLFKSAPKCILTLPINFLNTQHPAMQFTCSTVRQDSKAITTHKYCPVEAQKRSTNQRQTVRDSSGQLWLCMSNGYVSHIALVSIKKRWLKRQGDGSSDLDDPDGNEARGLTSQCYDIVPIVQSAGDICKSHIYCAAQVRNFRKRVDKLEAQKVLSNNPTISANICMHDDDKLKEATDKRKLLIDKAFKSNSPPVNIKLGCSPTSSIDPRSRFLSESAPSHTNSLDQERLSSDKPSFASATHLEVPSYADVRSVTQPRTLPSEHSACDIRSRRLIYENQKYQSLHNCFISSTPEADHRSQLNANSQSHHHHQHHHHHHHHPHHHHHSHHHSHLHHHFSHQHPQNYNHIPHNLYNSRHHTVPIAELRKALERQHRVSEMQASRYCESNQLIQPANTPSDPTSTMATSSNRQQISSLDLAERYVSRAANSADKRIPSATPPTGRANSKSFRSARLLRHQASLKTSSILAKLVGGASKKSMLLRKNTQSTTDRPQIDCDDNDTDTDSGNPQQHPSVRHEDTSSVDSNILALTAPTANKYLLNTSNPDLNNVVISPLSSVSSLASTNSSITVNSACASSPNRSTCDLIAHSSSTTCCTQSRSRDTDQCITTKSSCGLHNECGLRSRSATVPSRTLFQQSLESSERTLCCNEDCNQGALTSATQMVCDESYKVSEIINSSMDKGLNFDLDHNKRVDSKMDSSLWLGCDDGSLIIINCLDNNLGGDDCNMCEFNQSNLNCGNVHSEVKLNAAICDIRTYKDEMVFVAMSNGQLAIFSKDSDSNKDNSSNDWILNNPKVLTVTSNELNSLETTIMAPTNDPSLQFTMQSIAIDDMELMSNLSGVWVSFRNSHLIQFYDIKRYKLLVEINLYEPVNKILSYGNEIIRQHKTACLKATSLLNVNNSLERCNTLFIGTSAGIILYLKMTHEQLESKDSQLDGSTVDWNPQVACLRNGHSGPVKFMHFIEVENEHDGDMLTSENVNSGQNCAGVGTTCRRGEKEAKEILLISGGTGIDFYGPQDEQQVVSSINNDEDNLNQMILWQL